MFGFRLISRGRGAGGRSGGSGRRWLALFWGLALVPLLGWGQEIIEHPQNVTVCVGERAIFTSIVNGAGSSWQINGTSFGNLGPYIHTLFMVSPVSIDDQGNDDQGNSILSVTALPNDTAVLNNTRVQSFVFTSSPNFSEVTSEPAYLSYKANLQYPATNLKTIPMNLTPDDLKIANWWE